MSSLSLVQGFSRTAHGPKAHPAQCPLLTRRNSRAFGAELASRYPSPPSSHLQHRDLMGCPGLWHLKSLNRLSFLNWSSHICYHVNCGTFKSTLSVLCEDMPHIWFDLSQASFICCSGWEILSNLSSFSTSMPLIINFSWVYLLQSPQSSGLLVTLSCHLLSPDQPWPKCLCLPGALLEQQGLGLCWWQQERTPSTERS